MASLPERKAHGRGQLSWRVEHGALVPLSAEWARLINPNVPTRLCRECEEELPITCFEGGSILKTEGGGIAPDCIICEFKIRKAYRLEHAFELRAEAILRAHMRKEFQQGLHQCRSFAEYQLRIGMTVAQLAHRMRVEYENGYCQHCVTAGRSARWTVICPHPGEEGGLSRMTCDRTNTSRLFGPDNFTFMCWTGNVAKHQTDEATYDDRQAYWRLYNLAHPEEGHDQDEF